MPSGNTSLCLKRHARGIASRHMLKFILRAFRQYLSLPETACERNCLAAHAQVISLQFLRNGQETKYGVREEDCKPGI